MCQHIHTHSVHVPSIKDINLYVCWPLLALRVVKYRSHAGMKVLVLTKTFSALKCHLCAHYFFFILLDEQNSQRELFLFLIFVSLMWVPGTSAHVPCSVVYFHDLFCLFCVKISCYKSTRDILYHIAPKIYVSRCIEKT